jgi:hypothetical protein
LDRQYERLGPALENTYDQLVDFYQLEVELPVTLDKHRPWDLQVLDGTGKRLKNVKILYPHEFFPCGQTASGK